MNTTTSKMKKGLSAWVLAGGIAAGGLAMAQPASAACSLGANLPAKNSAGKIFGVGTRGTTCSSSATITVQVRQQRTLQPDDVIAQNSGTGTANISVTATSSKSSGKVRTRTTSSTGAQTESAWTNP
jgi:hypothetical protein